MVCIRLIKNIAGGGASTAQPLRTRRTARRSLSSTNIASTLANIISLIKEWSLIRTLNHRVSYLFCIYQIYLLTSTFIGFSTVIIIVTGGLA
ncbi:uncharacterized protein LOC144623220 isoform X3 [Crassostrea virginica]